MARAKKIEEKGSATIQIDVESFLRTRDSVVSGLQTLQDAIRSLSSAYIKHTNAVLGEHSAGLDDVHAAFAKLSENSVFGLSDSLSRPFSPVKASADHVPEKKERKKRHHDPNAPKRPLTPFFLYMQTARPIIANDLGADVPKGAVGVEGQRRWQTMLDEDKQLWTDAYKENLRLYNARIHSYKAGNANAKDMDEAEAARYAAEHDISVPALENSVDIPLAEESPVAILHEEVESEPHHEPTPQPKTPTSKSSRKGKSKPSPSEDSNEMEAVHSSSEASVPLVPEEREKSPERKRKRPKKNEGPSRKEVMAESIRLPTKMKKKKNKNE
ncbi:hypothetical protein K3495_g8823 [Podosphaera aphanis]|nr:hypothetical protein K3495_g8823 [Podosphaera aphanis]